jgi:FMN phosphatase YigB (HAD superfamily)
MKKVAFDLGRIIVNVDFSPFLDMWHSHGLFKIKDASTFFNDLHGQQDVGLTTIDRGLRERFNLNSQVIDDLGRAWDDSISINEDMASLLNGLKDEGYTVAILSNIGTRHAKVMREKFPSIFHHSILHLSCEVGARKPTKLYFQSFMMDHPEFKGALFIDDLAENRQQAERYGLRSYAFELAIFEKLSPQGKRHELDSLRRAIDA